jgi:adenylate kinase
MPDPTKVFVNNVDSYVGNALCLGMHSTGSFRIVGTLKGGENNMVPPNVKRIIPRVIPTQLLKTLAQCQVVVYNLHDADLEELEFIVQAIDHGDFTQPITFILVSTVATWGCTQCEREPVPEEPPEEPPAEEAAEAVEGEVPAETPAAAEDLEMEEEGEAPEKKEPSKQEPARPQMRPQTILEKEFERRKPMVKYLGWHLLEQRFLTLNRKENVKSYIVAAGILYGCGELSMHDPFASALLFGGSQHRTLGPGENYLPMAHVLDVVGLVQHLAVQATDPAGTPLTQRYLLSVDREPATQRSVLEAVVKTLGDPAMLPLKSVEYEQALTVENADLLACLDLRLEPTSAMLEEGFAWTHSGSFVADAEAVAQEFAEWRDIRPIHIAVGGPPCLGKTALCAKLAAAFNTEHIAVATLLEKLRAEDPPSDLAAELSEAGELEKAWEELSPEVQSRLVERALRTSACRYRGFVLDGYPRSQQDAELLFVEPPEPVGELAEGEEPPPPPPKTLRPIAPLLAVVLTMPNEAEHLARVQELYGAEDAAGRVEGQNDEAGFQRRLARYKEAPSSVDFYTEHLPERILTIDVTGRADQDVFQEAAEALLRKDLPFNYIAPIDFPPPPETVEEQVEEPAIDEAAIALAKREEEERARERALIERERELLVKQSKPLRDYLSEVVVPPVIEALMEICHLQPADPVDYLAEYLFHAATNKEELGPLPKHWADLEWTPQPPGDDETGTGS